MASCDSSGWLSIDTDGEAVAGSVVLGTGVTALSRGEMAGPVTVGDTDTEDTSNVTEEKGLGVPPIVSKDGVAAKSTELWSGETLLLGKPVIAVTGGPGELTAARVAD